MKTSIKIVITAIVLLSFNSKVTAQIEDHYHSFSGKIYIPIIVDRQEEIKFNDGRINERSIPDKETGVSFYMKAEDMRVSKGVFSGIIVRNNLVEDEVITYKGKVSKDNKKLEYIEITKDYTIYVLDNREDVEKTISFSARFENVPKSYGGFEYEFGITNITSVSYNEEYAVPRYGYIDSYTETFVKINEKAISKYYRGVTANFKPGVLELEEVNHLTISGPDTICREVVGEDPYLDTDIVLVANSDIPDGNFNWECEFESLNDPYDNAILIMRLDEGNGSKILVRALAEYLPSPDSVEIKVTQKIGVLEYTATHKLNLKGGYFYFWPDCDELLKRGVITKAEWDECDVDLWDCEDTLDKDPCNQELDPEYLPFILQEHLLSNSSLADPDFKLDSKKLNWFYKLWDENGDDYPESVRADLREFVTTFPCMEKWVKLSDKIK